MIVLGIDPGTQRTGYGLVELSSGVMRHVASGVIAPKGKQELSQRLVVIHESLVDVLKQHRPSEAAVEDVFFAKFPQGALKLGHARGVVLLALAQSGLTVHSYPPAQVKRAISGHGRADKAQIARLVSMLLSLKKPPQADQADALSVAICHCAGLARRLKSKPVAG